VENSTLIELNVLMPEMIFYNNKEISRIQVSTQSGSFGILPRRLDGVAPLSSGILTCVDREGKEFFIAVDQGILTKTGNIVTVSVRNALADEDLGALHLAIENQFRNLDEEELKARKVMAQLETGFIKNFEQLTKK